MSLPNVGFVVGYFASGIAVQISRSAAVTISDAGRAVPGVAVVSALEAMPVPGSGRTIRRERDGQTSTETLELFTTDLDISTVRVETGRPPDVIIYDGIRWIADRADPWDEAGYRRLEIRREEP